MKTLFTYLGQYPSEDQFQDIVTALDDNGDGVISFDEFKGSMYTYMRIAEGMMEIKEAFRIFDKVLVASHQCSFDTTLVSRIAMVSFQQSN